MATPGDPESDRLYLNCSKMKNKLDELTHGPVRQFIKQFAAEVTNRFTALEDEVTPDALWKGTMTVLLEMARETIGPVKSLKKKK